MSSNVKAILDSLEKIRSQSRKARTFFTVLFVIICVGGSLLLSLVAVNIANPGLLPFDTTLNLSSFILLLVSLIVWAIFFLVVRSIFNEIGAGRSPFTFKLAKQIKLLGFLFIADFLLSLLIPPAFSAMGQIGALNVGYMASQVASYSVLSIDIKGLIGAVVCLALSTAWRYGALLQAEADETF